MAQRSILRAERSVPVTDELGRSAADHLVIKGVAGPSSSPSSLPHRACGGLGHAAWGVDHNGELYGASYYGNILFMLSCCDAEANSDGLVDPLDAGYVLGRFGCPAGTGDPDCDAADQNGDGTVDPLDAGFVLARFGECP